jgi:hypothetical protein
MNKCRYLEMTSMSCALDKRKHKMYDVDAEVVRDGRCDEHLGWFEVSNVVKARKANGCTYDFVSHWQRIPHGCRTSDYRAHSAVCEVGKEQSPDDGGHEDVYDKVGGSGVAAL